MTVQQLEAGWELHTLPSGGHVAYNDDRHGYYRAVNDGKGVGRLLGVSTAAKALDLNPDPLISWGARLDREGVAALASDCLDCDSIEQARSQLAWLASGESIGAALDDAGLSWRKRRFDAASRGTRVHLHALHALSSGEQVPSFDELPEDERGYASAVLKWWLDYQPEVIAAEQVVADLTDGVAGRLDLLCRLKDGRVAIVDAKTGRYLAASWVAQLAGYRRLALLSGFEAAEVGVILQVAEDGSYRHVEVELSDTQWLTALATYRLAGELGRQLKKAAA